MSDPYLPPSPFLHEVINENIPFGERDIGKVNLKRLMAMTCDHDTANRDWATLLLAQLQLDRPDVRKALLIAATDENACVRGEAILGLAQIDRLAALPLLRNELQGEIVTGPLLEAAAIVADASLIPDLEAFARPSDNPWLDSLVSDAIVACQSQM